MLNTLLYFTLKFVWIGPIAKRENTQSDAGLFFRFFWIFSPGGNETEKRRFYTPYLYTFGTLYEKFLFPW